MLNAIVTGTISGLTVALARFVGEHIISGLSLTLGISLCFLAAVIILYPLLVRQKVFALPPSSLSDLFAHILTPADKTSGVTWLLRGSISFIFALCGGLVGVEGAAIEYAQAFHIRVQARVARWFELKRRTGAATALAGGVAAAFGTPFAATILPMELEVGGRSVAAATSALVAFLTIKFLSKFLGLYEFNIQQSLTVFSLNGNNVWALVILIGIVSGILGAVAIRLIRYIVVGFQVLTERGVLLKILLGMLLLLVILMIYPAVQASPWFILNEVFWAKSSWNEMALFFAAKLIVVGVVLALSGSSGIFWPIFMLGSLLGFEVGHLSILAPIAFPLVTALIGGAAFFGSVLNAPIAGALVGFELSQSVPVFLACLVASILAQQLRRLLKTQSLLNIELTNRELYLMEGRSKKILDAIYVEDAMVIDYEWAYENENVNGLHEKVQKSRYPFLVVVDLQKNYKGLLTVDLIQENWQKSKTRNLNPGANSGAGVSSGSGLGALVEAKDLLYRSGIKIPALKLKDRLSLTIGLFDELPCIAVVGDRGEACGLLFNYGVRLAYDREVARRSFSFVREGEE